MLINKFNFWLDKKIWLRSSINTFFCLIGCSIGDFGAMIFLQKYFPNIPLILNMQISMFSGILSSIIFESIILKFREKLTLVQCLKTALTMNFLSMLIMEFTENITDYFLTGGNISFNKPFYWIAVIISMIIGFLFPLPYNYYILKKYNKSCCKV